MSGWLISNHSHTNTLFVTNGYFSLLEEFDSLMIDICHSLGRFSLLHKTCDKGRIIHELFTPSHCVFNQIWEPNMKAGLYIFQESFLTTWWRVLMRTNLGSTLMDVYCKLVGQFCGTTNGYCLTYSKGCSQISCHEEVEVF